MVDEAGESDGGPGSDSIAEAESGLSVGARLKRVWANPAYRFVILFLPYLGIAAVVYPRLAKNYNHLIQYVMLGTANLLGWIFGLFTDKVSGSNKMLAYDGFTVRIVDECTGIYEVIIFTAAVLAFPSRPREKVIGIVVGNFIIYAFNILRISFLILIGRFSPSIFEFMHLYFWQATMILMIASVWLLWLFQVVRRGQTSRASRS